MEWNFDEYLISTDKELLSVEQIAGLLQQSYWANERSTETIKRSLENSFCYGVYHQGKQIGLARVITDWATIYWVCDVIIDATYRGKGLGTKLMKCIVETPKLQGLKAILATQDAHGLYAKFGFKRDGERFMRK